MPYYKFILKILADLCVTSSLLVTSHESNTFSMSCMYYMLIVHVGTNANGLRDDTLQSAGET